MKISNFNTFHSVLLASFFFNSLAFATTPIGHPNCKNPVFQMLNNGKPIEQSNGQRVDIADPFAIRSDWDGLESTPDTIRIWGTTGGFYICPTSLYPEGCASSGGFYTEGLSQTVVVMAEANSGSTATNFDYGSSWGCNSNKPSGSQSTTDCGGSPGQNPKHPALRGDVENWDTDPNFYGVETVALINDENGNLRSINLQYRYNSQLPSGSVAKNLNLGSAMSSDGGKTFTFQNNNLSLIEGQDPSLLGPLSMLTVGTATTNWLKFPAPNTQTIQEQRFIGGPQEVSIVKVGEDYRVYFVGIAECSQANCGIDFKSASGQQDTRLMYYEFHGDAFENPFEKIYWPDPDVTTPTIVAMGDDFNHAQVVLSPDGTFHMYTRKKGPLGAPEVTRIGHSWSTNGINWSSVQTVMTTTSLGDNGNPELEGYAYSPYPLVQGEPQLRIEQQVDRLGGPAPLVNRDGVIVNGPNGYPVVYFMGGRGNFTDPYTFAMEMTQCQD